MSCVCEQCCPSPEHQDPLMKIVVVFCDCDDWGGKIPEAGPGTRCGEVDRAVGSQVCCSQVIPGPRRVDV